MDGGSPRLGSPVPVRLKPSAQRRARSSLGSRGLPHPGSQIALGFVLRLGAGEELNRARKRRLAEETVDVLSENCPVPCGLRRLAAAGGPVAEAQAVGAVRSPAILDVLDGPLNVLWVKRLEHLGGVPQPLETPLGSARLELEVLAGADRWIIATALRQHEETLAGDPKSLAQPELLDDQPQRVEVDAGLGASGGQIGGLRVPGPVRIGLDLADDELDQSGFSSLGRRTRASIATLPSGSITGCPGTWRVAAATTAGSFLSPDAPSLAAAISRSRVLP